MAPVIVIGSGKIAQDFGARFLAEGSEVTWISRDEKRLSTLGRKIKRLTRRWARDREGAPPAGSASFALTSAAAALGSTPSIILECVAETLEAKHAAARLAESLAGVETLLLSASSSFLPSEHGPRWLGAHPFYPLELTSLVELVVPRDCDGTREAAAFDVLENLGLDIVTQDERQAFALNRALLPLQAECFAALGEGMAPAIVDEASQLASLPVGQLALMDSVGLDTIRAAASRYTSRLAPLVAASYSPLIEGLELLLAAGKRGKKNGEGLLCGRALPPLDLGENLGAATPSALRERLELLWMSSLSWVRKAALMTPSDEFALASLYGAPAPFDQAFEGLEKKDALTRIQGLFERTGLQYFRPARERESGPGGAATLLESPPF